MTCDQARELVPFYAARSLPEFEGAALIAHVVGCEGCQSDLVETMSLGHELRRAFAAVPGPPEGTCLSVIANTVGVPLLRVDLGGDLAGFSVDVGAVRSGVPITGRLSILGREVPILRI